MALAAEGKFEIRFRKFFRILEVLSQFAVAFRTGEGGMLISGLKRFDLLVTLVASGFFL